MARFERFRPRWSALWAQHQRQMQLQHLQSGGNCTIRGTTRRRHAASQLLVLQTPHQCRRIERSSQAGRHPRVPKQHQCQRSARMQQRCQHGELDQPELDQPGRETHTPQRPAQTNIARNFRPSVFERTRKCCDSNDLRLQLEEPLGELRAKLPEPTYVARNNDSPQRIATTLLHRSI